MFRTPIHCASLMLALITLPAVAASAAARHRAVHAATVHTIVIDKMQYGPMPTDVHVGDVLEWRNQDMFEHSATARDGSFDVDLKPGSSGRITVKAGSIAFFCKFHPGMSATVVVN